MSYNDIPKLHEECGVFGILSTEPRDIIADTYYALFALQHRGQESCGIAINDAGVISGYKGAGLVSDVFTEEVLKNLPRGQMAVAHCRYGTKHNLHRDNAQPLIIHHVKGGMAIAHNGSLTNSFELRRELELEGAIFHTSSDAEVIAYIITKERLKTDSIETAVARAMKKLKGAFSLCIMSPQKLIAVRDPQGFRPLCVGKIDGGYVVASESCAFDSIGATMLCDVLPGEIVVINKDGLKSDLSNKGKKTSACIFEFIYFARPDSVIDGSDVHVARQRAGAFLALDHPVDADVVIGVPDSGLDAAIGYSRQSGLPYGIGFIKNRYIGRTFISPQQKGRETAVQIKLNPIASVVSGERVVLVDDSIVRGTTIAHIVGMLRAAGATEVHARLSAPPFKYPCYFGTDIDSSESLIAYKHSIEEIRKIIDVDSIGYLGVEHLPKLAYRSGCDFCNACFTGEYPCEIPTKAQQCRFDNKLRYREGEY
ncbi:MAG: amidophosphoribosyltransferase [Ruminococcaceae bacterium]|nr:amidophosphoribosyltransferase [Oscillospiraceae bacterium]